MGGAGNRARAGRLMLWDWNYTFEILPELARAALVTIEATLIGFILAATLGLALAILRMLLDGRPHFQ